MIFWKSLLKRFGWIVIPLTVIFGGIVSTFFLSEVEKAKVLRETRETLNVDIGKKAIARNLKNVIADLMVLSQHNFFSRMGAIADAAGSPLAEDMLLFLKEKRSYDQIRYLDETGMEVIRVNFNSGQPAIVIRDRLQNKKNRYYFKETFDLSRGKTFFSPFDLNVEHGKIEVPFKPMIRLGTPVFDGQGRKRGIVLINYFGKELIHDFSTAVANIADHMMLLNSDGYWLHHPDPKLEWGFMLDHQQKFGKLFPNTWKRITGAEAGQFLDSDGLFTFDTVYPVREGREIGDGVGEAGAQTLKYFWKSVAHVPMATIDAVTSNIITKLLRIAGPLYLILVLGSLWLSYALTRRAETTLALAAMNEELKELDELKNKFMGMAAHDLRNPINAIRGMSQLINRNGYRGGAGEGVPRLHQ